MAHIFGELTAFIPILKRDTYGEWIFDTENDGTPEHPIRAPHVLYTAAADRFVKALYRFCNAHPEYGHTHYAETLERCGAAWSAAGMENADLSNADAELVIALLIGAVRADRFSDGTLLAFFKNGGIVRWLERLEEIDRQTEIQNG